jgi:hypothetical protein
MVSRLPPPTPAVGHEIDRDGRENKHKYEQHEMDESALLRSCSLEPGIAASRRWAIHFPLFGRRRTVNDARLLW